MSKGFVVAWMLFMHVLDDYTLQGCLGNLKQRQFWKDHAPDRMYRFDYIVALVMHAVSWSFCIMLPLAVYAGFSCHAAFLGMFFGNVCVHAAVDDLKANRHKINLITDQAIHIAQIFLTALLLW